MQVVHSIDLLLSELLYNNGSNDSLTTITNALSGGKFVVLFSSGDVASGSSATLNVAQSTAGNYKGLIVKLFNGSINNTVFAYIPKSMITRNTNLYVPVQFEAVTSYIHTIPALRITDTAMTFDWGNNAYVLTDIYAEI